MKLFIVVLMLLLLAACAELPPRNTDNLCAIFKEKPDWYAQSNQATQNWGVSVPVMMAIMQQESHFVADAKPPRTWLLGFIPWFRPSSAYGYAQALDGTWSEYRHNAGNFFADRDDFADAVDFIGWYVRESHSRAGIAVQDTRNLYLAYYTGIEGYLRNHHRKNAELQRIASKVAHQAQLFHWQLRHCQFN